MKKGIVNYFSKEKGFGFILEENGREVFFHISGLKQEVQLYDKVYFQEKELRSGVSATDIYLEADINGKLQSSY